MGIYGAIPVEQAYRLMGHGPLVLVSTRSAKGAYDIAPVAWNTPVEKLPCRAAVVIDRGHKTFQNISETGEFAVCVPKAAQACMVRLAGSISGREAGKFEAFHIPWIPGVTMDVRIPEGILGHLECGVLKILDFDDAAIVIGECRYAAADPRGFNGRVLAEFPDGKTLHHLGEKIFAVPGDVPDRP